MEWDFEVLACFLGLSPLLHFSFHGSQRTFFVWVNSMGRENDNWLSLLFDFREDSYRRSLTDGIYTKKKFKTEVRNNLKMKNSY